MPSAKRRKPESPSQPVLAEAVGAESKSAASQMPHVESPADDYPRLLLALRDAAPGDLIFVQLNSPVQRRQLPGKLAADGLQRPFVVADFATFRPGPPPDGMLREFLEEEKSAPPEILFVDGLEHWIEADPKTLDVLNLGRERLASLGVVVVFLLPAYLIDQIRTQALNLWSWRAHYYSLPEREGELQFPDKDQAIAPGDTPEARDRRIRILRRLLAEGLAEHRTIESLTPSILLPLVRELRDAGRFADALAELEQITDSLEKAEDSADKALLLDLRGRMLQAFGRFHEAELLYRQALAIREKMLGPEHIAVAASLHNLAMLYRIQGQYAQAESLYTRALAIAEKTWGPDHPNVAATLNNLAGLYYAQNRYAEAEPLFKRALVIREKVLGPEHPDVAANLNNLAELYSSQGRYGEAESLFRRAISIDEKVLGLEHPELAPDLNNLGGLYYAQGRYAKAEPLFKRALALVEKALGPDHPNVAASLNNLALLYHVQGKYAEAAPLLQRALRVREKILGPDHPDVATTLKNYAALLRKTNREAEAAKLEARAQAVREKHGRENPTPPK